MARALGERVPAFPYPRTEDGAHTMAFVEACIASKASGGWVDGAGPQWRRAPLPATTESSARAYGRPDRDLRGESAALSMSSATSASIPYSFKAGTATCLASPPMITTTVSAVGPAPKV